jgi:hypothetical protein
MRGKAAKEKDFVAFSTQPVYKKGSAFVSYSIFTDQTATQRRQPRPATPAQPQPGVEEGGR